MTTHMVLQGAVRLLTDRHSLYYNGAEPEAPRKQTFGMSNCFQGNRENDHSGPATEDPSEALSLSTL